VGGSERRGRKSHNEELCDECCSTNIIRETGSRRMGCEGQVAWVGKKRNPQKFFVVKTEGKRHLGLPRHRWWVILKWVLKTWDGTACKCMPLAQQGDFNFVGGGGCWGFCLGEEL
jgi:hypothetical protein